MVTQLCCARMKKNGLFGERIRCETTLDLIICLKQIKQQWLLPTCAPISELLSIIITMEWIGFWVFYHLLNSVFL